MAPQRHTRSSSKKWIRGIAWLPLLFVLLCAPSLAAPLIKLTPDFAQTDITRFADLLVDPSLQLTVEQVAHETIANNFTPASPALFRNADRRNAYWLRFGIDNPLSEARVLAVNLRVANDVAITVFTSSLQQLPLQRTPLLTLLIPPQSKQLFYLRIGPGPLELSQFELLSLDRYFANYHALSWLTGLFQGGLLFIAIAAIGAKLLRGDNAYLWLAGNCTAVVVFQTLYRADFNPLLFDYTPDWNLRSPLLQTCLILSNIFCIRLAQNLRITHTARGLQSLNLLAIACALAIPVVFVLDTPINTAITICASLLTVAMTLTIALYNFLFSHRRELLFYSLARLFLLIISVGGSFAWRGNSDLRLMTDNTLPLAMTVEAICMLGILWWRSFEQQREQAHSEREIATLEAEARSRTEMVAEVGHRVRTPTSGMLGMLDMLQDTSLSTTQLDYLNTIRRAGNELLNAINEISDISRLQSPAIKLQQNIFDPHTLLAECIDGFRSAAAAHHLELISDIAPELPAYVSGDLTRLRQIILQLLHQVVSQHERGEIVLRVQQVRDNWLRFDIQTHAGMTMTLNGQDRRTHPPGSANVRFAIAHQLIDMLGGHIQITDLADGNLRAGFDLELPTVERNAPSGVRDETLQGRRLLVIDDNATLCNVLERQLSHWGMTVYTAAGINEGLARLRNQLTLTQPIDALLLDTDMPELHHSDWLQRLRHDIHPSPVIIYLASEAVLGSTAKPFDAGRIVLKPINQASLKITLIEAFKQREQRLLPNARTRNEPIRCLFAEDNIINAKVLAGMLDKLGVIYTAANNGLEAVEACRRELFDIVLMDCDMPVMDGWEASRRIREMFENRGLASIPIIALTANTVEEIGERARELAMDAHLVKPIRLQSLRELLEQWTGKIVTLPNALSN